MPNFDNVPIVDIHKDNFAQLWPSAVLAIKTASFIAIDTELSGLGNRRALLAKSVEDRYKSISAAAKSRSIISLGLSCFKLLPEQPDSNTKVWKYTVQTFNITTLCTDEYIVEPTSLQFLIDHGFDFNKQYAQGVPYYKGNDKVEESSKLNLRHLFTELILSNHTLVFHNGLVDLVFLYHCCYAALPQQFGTFLCDIDEAFSQGVYDTKYVAEFVTHSSASYLEYLFRKLQRENVHNASTQQSYVSMQFLDYSSTIPFIEYLSLGVDTMGLRTVAASQVCMSYANHGWCPNGRNCTLSHNVDCILDMEIMPCKKRRRVKNAKEEVPNKKRSSLESLKSTSLTDNTMDLAKCPSPVGDNGCAGNHVVSICHSLSCHQLKMHYGAPGDVETNGSNDVPCLTNKSEPKCETMLTVVDSNQSSEYATIALSNQKASCNGPAAGKANELPTNNVNDMTERLGRKPTGHRAGCDAFMTGFTMACFLASHGHLPVNVGSFTPADTGTEEMRNRVYLSGKDVPLIIQKSSFTKTSKSHQDKMEKLRELNKSET